MVLQPWVTVTITGVSGAVFLGAVPTGFEGFLKRTKYLFWGLEGAVSVRLLTIKFGNWLQRCC